MPRVGSPATSFPTFNPPYSGGVYTVPWRYSSRRKLIDASGVVQFSLFLGEEIKSGESERVFVRAVIDLTSYPEDLLGAMNMGQTSEPNQSDDISRRNWLTTLGALAGAVGLAGVAPNAQALSGVTNIRWVDTVASLRALAGAPHWIAIVEGYSRPADGGGGVFVWDATPRADDGGTSFNLGATARAGWRRIYSGALNVRWFGARGDNASADDAAIQRAIQAAYDINPYLNMHGGRSVYLAPGLYQLANPLVIAKGAIATDPRSGLIFWGEGWQSVLVPRPGVATAILVQSGYGALRDFAIEGASRGATAGGIVMRGGISTKLTNVYINRCAGDGILFDNDYPAAVNYAGNNDLATLTQCLIGNCGGYGIQLKPGSDNNLITFRDCMVQNNARAGLLLRGSHNIVEGGDWSYNGGYGIVLSDPTDTSVSVGNTLLYPYTDSMVNTVHNAGKAHQSLIHLNYGSARPPLTTFSGIKNQAFGDMVIMPDWDNPNGPGLAFVIDHSDQNRGLKVTAAGGLPVTQVYAEGDPNIELWLHSKGTGGIRLGSYADPFQAQFSKTTSVQNLAIPAGGSSAVVVPLSNNTYASATVKVGDIATASFSAVLPPGVYIRSAEVTGPFAVTVTFQNSSSINQSISGVVRAQVTAY